MNNFTKENFLTYIKFRDEVICKRSNERKAGYKKTEKYYADAYDAVVFEKKNYYWNGYAALFNFCWLLHRRMYFEAFLSLMVLGILDLFGKSLFPMKSMTYLIYSFTSYGLLFLVFGLFGTPLYIRCIKERIEANKTLPPSPIDWSVVFLAVLVIPLLATFIVPSFIIPFLGFSPDVGFMTNLGIYLSLLALAFFKYARAYSKNMV